MIEIRDCYDRLICKGDPFTGLLSVNFKKPEQKVEFTLIPGQKYFVERDGIRTVIEYTAYEYFLVDSYKYV